MITAGPSCGMTHLLGGSGSSDNLVVFGYAPSSNTAPNFATFGSWCYEWQLYLVPSTLVQFLNLEPRSVRLVKSKADCKVLIASLRNHRKERKESLSDIYRQHLHNGKSQHRQISKLQDPCPQNANKWRTRRSSECGDGEGWRRWQPSWIITPQ